MQFSDTTNKNGIIQAFEFWARLPDGEVTGTLLKQITARVNAAFDNLMPLLLSYDDNIRWDDTTHSDRPIGTVDIVSGQNDYTITEDDNSLDILNIARVRILSSSSDTSYSELTRLRVDDERALRAMSPNSDETGIPTHFLERGNTIFLYPEPNYSATDGIQLFFEREQNYFSSTDTTKEPGIPKPFHELLALYPAYDYVSVNRPSDTNTLNIIQQRIRMKQQDLEDLISKRNPVKIRAIPSNHSNK